MPMARAAASAAKRWKRSSQALPTSIAVSPDNAIPDAKTYTGGQVGRTRSTTAISRIAVTLATMPATKDSSGSLMRWEAVEAAHCPHDRGGESPEPARKPDAQAIRFGNARSQQDGQPIIDELLDTATPAIRAKPRLAIDRTGGVAKG